MSLANDLATSVRENDYFEDLLGLVEKGVAESFLRIPVTSPISHQEKRDLLRFADILSHSSDPENRNISYRVVAQLTEFEGIDQELAIYAEAILVKLGNFPGLAFLRSKYTEPVFLPVERELDKLTKKLTQGTSSGNLTFTDSQFRIREQLKKHDYFSFSGPTSIGKSFIIKDFIRVLASSAELHDSCIVVLVPTRALITQVVSDLRHEIDDPSVNIVAFPASSPYLKNRFQSTVYVFTPERLLSFISKDIAPIKCLVVDEAQKVTSVNDERSSLYYHAIYETIRKYATRLIFASPNIPNPEIFLDIFEREQRGAISVVDRTVSQNRYFIDQVDDQVTYYGTQLSEGASAESTLGGFDSKVSQHEIIRTLGSGVSNLVYCNSASETVKQALEFASAAQFLPMTEDLQDLVDFVSEFVHDDYYLIDCLKKGVAFHHGRMPQQVRDRVEQMFSSPESRLRYVFCTSTLLEGVNLPAKNIFVLTELHGRSSFDLLDFENLIGRAGRLTREFSGNVICIRSDEKRWRNKGLLAANTPARVESFLTDPSLRRKREFSNIGKVLLGKEVAKGINAASRSNYRNYASMLLLHNMESANTPLKARFLEKISDGHNILRKATSDNLIPSHIIRTSPTILPHYQNAALNYIRANGSNSQYLNIDSENMDFMPMLEMLYDVYGWGVEETRGSSPLIPAALVASGYGKSRLKYWSMLMKHWVKSEPLSRLIVFSIHYHERQGYIWFRENGRPVREDFIRNARHVNIIIEQVMTDIENGLRFRIVRYLQNYFDISRYVLSGNDLGVNLAEFVEYGTLDRKSISLQNTGFTRIASEYLLSNFAEAFVFNDSDELLSMDSGKLRDGIDPRHELFSEISEIAYLN